MWSFHQDEMGINKYIYYVAYSIFVDFILAVIGHNNYLLYMKVYSHANILPDNANMPMFTMFPTGFEHVSLLMFYH